MPNNETLKVICTVPKINPKDIPKVEMNILCTGLLEVIEELSKDPVVMAGFDEWIKTYKYKDVS